MQDYRKLRVWQNAHGLAVATYKLTPILVRPDAWPLRDQILRSVISISSNIAEGAGRGSNPEFVRFLWFSMGSCNELESQLLLAHDLTLVSKPVHDGLASQIADVRRMLTGLIATLK